MQKSKFLQDDSGNSSHKRLMSTTAFALFCLIVVMNLFFNMHIEDNLLAAILLLIFGSTGMSVLEKFQNQKMTKLTKQEAE